MFADYQMLVLLDYQKKRNTNVLPLSLARPSPAKVRDECLRVCNERFDRKDERTLRDFFGQGSDKAAYLRAIERFDIDRFKPLINYLKKPTSKPEEKNIELLAWLIDFDDRPWEPGKKYALDTPESKVMATQPALANSGPNRKKRKSAVWLLLFLVVVIGIYWIWSIMASGRQGACMVWAGDHYKPIECNQRVGDTPVIPLDTERLIHFRKITRQDTISEASLGYVWFTKYNGAYECYTAPGYHPIDTSLKLKLLTDYVLINHIRSPQDAEKARK